MFHIEDALKETCPHCGADLSEQNARYMGRLCHVCNTQIDFGAAIHELRKRIIELESKIRKDNDDE